ncbi:MAG TPA: hypothetical protein DCY40_06160 [Actinobacteria bacterium]|nr:hypothetical protein [Actinomycetota bacterium]
MHERGAVGLAVDAFLRDTAGMAIGRVSARLGPGVDPEVVRQVWEHHAGGSHAEGASLDLRPAIGAMLCFSCGAEYPGAKLDTCPHCGGSGLPVVVPPELAIYDWGPS